MTQEERLDYLIHYLLNEDEQYQGFNILSNETDKKRLLRSLMNVRPPKKISQNFLNIQDLYLQEELKKQKIISIEELVSVQKGLYLWQGDITKLKADAIVNAGNSALLGCLFLARDVLIMRYILMQVFSCVWNVSISWKNKEYQNRQERQKSQKAIIFLQNMYCIQSDRSYEEN